MFNCKGEGVIRLFESENVVRFEIKPIKMLDFDFLQALSKA